MKQHDFCTASLGSQTDSLFFFRLLLLVLFLTMVNVGQANQLDSLRALLEGQLTPEQEVDVLLELGQIQGNRTLEESLKTLNKGLSMARTHKYLRGEVTGHNALGSFYARRGQTDSAFHHYGSAQKILIDSEGLELEKLDVLYGVGLTHLIGNNHDSALVYFQQLLTESESMDELDVQAKALLMLGSVSSIKSRTDEAIRYQLEALALAEKTENLGYQAILQNNLSLDYYRIRDHENALIHAQNALMLADESDLWTTSSIRTNIGLNQAELGNLKEAMKNHQISYDQLLKLGDTCRLVIPLNNMTDLLAKADTDSAIRVNHRLLTISKGCNNDQYQINALLGLGVIHFHKGNAIQARGYLEEGYELAKSIAYLERQDILAEQLYELYSQQLNDQQKAMYYLEIHDQLSDSLSDAANDREIARLESKFAFEKQKELLVAENERNSLLQEQELQRQRLFILIGIILVIALVAIGVLIARFRIKSKAQEAEKLREVGRFKEAMTGMIAHDLKNPLSVLNLKTASDPGARAMTGQMLHLVTNMLDVQKLETAAMPVKKKAVALYKLAQQAEEQVRLLLAEKNVRLEIDMKEEVGVLADHDLLFRIFVNLLTNAIKYSPLNGDIRIAAKQDGDQIQVAVSDQGPGISKEDQDAIFDPFGQVNPLHSGGVVSTGLGLTFCKLALQAHDSQISVNSKPGEGATFCFSLMTVGATDNAKPTKVKELTMSDKDREAIIAAIPILKQYELHQAIEMEEALASLTHRESEAVNQWVESVLNAAYAGNESNFEELLAEIEAR